MNRTLDDGSLDWRPDGGERDAKGYICAIDVISDQCLFTGQPEYIPRRPRFSNDDVVDFLYFIFGLPQ